MILVLVGAVLFGAAATTTAEYKFQYNLADYAVKFVKKVLGLEAKVQADVSAVAKKL